MKNPYVDIEFYVGSAKTFALKKINYFFICYFD